MKLNKHSLSRVILFLSVSLVYGERLLGTGGMDTAAIAQEEADRLARIEQARLAEIASEAEGAVRDYQLVEAKIEFAEEAVETLETAEILAESKPTTENQQALSSATEVAEDAVEDAANAIATFQESFENLDNEVKLAAESNSSTTIDIEFLQAKLTTLQAEIESPSTESASSSLSGNYLRGLLDIVGVCEFTVTGLSGSVQAVNLNGGSGGNVDDVYRLPLPLSLNCNKSDRKIVLADVTPSGPSNIPAATILEEQPAEGSPNCPSVTGGGVSERVLYAQHAAIAQQIKLDICLKLNQALSAGSYSKTYTLTIEPQEPIAD